MAEKMGRRKTQTQKHQNNLLCLQHLPGVYVIVSVTITVLTGTSLTVLPQVLAGTYAAWHYLRYWQVKQGLNLR